MINAKDAAKLTAQNIKPISLEDITIKIMEQARYGKDFCWVMDQIHPDDQRTLLENGYMVAKDGKDYRISW